MSDAALRTAALAKTLGGRHPVHALHPLGVEVEAVEPLRQSLEDLFVEVIAHTSSGASP